MLIGEIYWKYKMSNRRRTESTERLLLAAARRLGAYLKVFQLALTVGQFLFQLTDDVIGRLFTQFAL